MSDTHGSTGLRHRVPDRLFHWVMALTVITLGATAFLPVLNIRFDWVPIHWVAGVILGIAVVFHLGRVFFVHGLREMWPRVDDLRETVRDLRGAPLDDLAEAKYDAPQKAYHFAVATTVLVLLATGFLMLVKIDTTFWKRNPGLLSDQTWGIIYVLHGAAALFLLFLVILHVYFNFLPEHRALLVSMVRGKGPINAREGRQ